MITYAEMGFSANPQKYIIKVEKKVQAVDWQFNRRKPTETQVFPVEASFQFVRVDQQEVRDQFFKELQRWKWSSDLFYAFIRYNLAASRLAPLAGAAIALAFFL